MRWRLKGTLFALGLVATSVGGATPAPQAALAQPVARVTAAAIGAPGEREYRELRASLEYLLHGPPLPGSWPLLAAGLTGAWAIGWRRRSAALGGRSLDQRR